MKIWILTIGSSDVQLKSDKANQSAGGKTSKDMWTRWFSSVKSDCYLIPFSMAKKDSKELDEPYRVLARVLGRVYQKQPDLQDNIFNYLTFPLLEDFTQKVQQSGELSQIVLVLTDQSKIFADNRAERGQRSPYWQDTYELLPILKRYFSEQLPNAQVVEPIVLQPETVADSLDNWDSVLELVRQKFAVLNNDLLTTDSELEAMYVSHQASTPAISSAVQFMALSYFGDRVRFLVSHEQQVNSAKVLLGSNYLRQIQKGQAQRMLERYDYSGVNQLIGCYLQPEGQVLIDAAIQWNLAEFEKFESLLPESYRSYQSKMGWWLCGYESAYLAVIRYQQKNIVEALFHGFRAIEGLICCWAESRYSDHFIYDKKGSPQICESIQEKHPDYWMKIQEKNRDWIQKQIGDNQTRQAKGKEILRVGIGLFSQSLYLLFEEVYKDCKDNPYMKKGLFKAKDIRNQQFHRLLGLQEQNLFDAWGVKDFDEWKKTLLGCLNFIVQDAVNHEFSSLEEASLMARVHHDLEQQISEI